jgi:hypothetical protein
VIFFARPGATVRRENMIAEKACRLGKGKTLLKIGIASDGLWHFLQSGRGFVLSTLEWEP